MAFDFNRGRAINTGTVGNTGQSFDFDTGTIVNQRQLRQEADVRAGVESGAPFPARAGEGALTAGAKATGNLIPSAFSLVKNIASAIASPIDTAKGLGFSAEGAVRRAGQKVGLVGEAETEVQRQAESSFEAITQSLKDRFGSLDALQRSATNDPFGFGAEIVGLVAGGAGAIGRGAKVASTVQKTRQAVTQPIRAGAQLGKEAVGKGVSRVRQTGVVSPIEKPVETILTEGVTKKPPKIQLASDVGKKIEGTQKLKNPEIPISSKLDTFLKRGDEASKNPRIATPLELAGESAEDAVRVLGAMRKQLGEQKGGIIGGTVGKQATDFVPKVSANFKELISDRLGLTITKTGDLKNAPGRRSVITNPADRRLVLDLQKDLRGLGKNPTLRQVDDLVDRMQERVFSRAGQVGIVPVNSRVEAIIKNITNQLNTNVKRLAGGRFDKLNTDLTKVIELMNELNKKLGRKGERAGSLMKRVFSPSDARTKQMFEEIRQLTGIDLVEDSVMAKFAMEVAGDSRQASILEDLGILTGRAPGGSRIGALLDSVLKRAVDPAGRARRLIQQAEKQANKQK